MSASATLNRPAAADAGNPIEPRQQRAALAVAMLGFAVVTLDIGTAVLLAATVMLTLGLRRTRS
jgi:hypothetical protein